MPLLKKLTVSQKVKLMTGYAFASRFKAVYLIRSLGLDMGITLADDIHK